MSTKTKKQPTSHFKVVSKSRSQVKGTPLERYNTSDKPDTVHAVARNGAPNTEWNYTAFCDHTGGLRHLTEAEARDIAATRNKALGWTPGQLEGVIVYN